MLGKASIDEAWMILAKMGVNTGILREFNLDDSYVVELSRALQNLFTARSEGAIA